MKNENPIDILKKEHEEVLQILNRLEDGIAGKDTNSLTKNIAILEKEFDKHSLNKEEKALFPEMEKFIPREGGPTGMMIIEHQKLVELIKDFKEKLGTRNLEKLNEIGNNIFSILRPHIDKENNILFMMAEMHLDNEQKKAILEKFKEIDKG